VRKERKRLLSKQDLEGKKVEREDDGGESSTAKGVSDFEGDSPLI